MSLLFLTDGFWSCFQIDPARVSGAHVDDKDKHTAFPGTLPLRLFAVGAFRLAFIAFDFAMPAGHATSSLSFKAAFGLVAPLPGQGRLVLSNM